MMKLQFETSGIFHRIAIYYIFIFFGACLISGTVSAGTIDLNGAISFLTEGNDRLTIDQIMSGTYQSQFQKISGNQFYGGTSSRSYWLKIDPLDAVISADDRFLLELDTNKLNKIDLFFMKNGELTHLEDGINYAGPKSGKPIRNFVFFLDGASFKHPIYLRLNAFFYQVPIHIWPDDARYAKMITQSLTDGFFYGITLAIIVYQLFMFFAIRDKSYLTYAIFLVTVVFTYLSGQGILFAYFFRSLAPPLSVNTHGMGPLSGWFLLLVGIQFTKEYLKISTYAKKLSVIFRALQIALLAVGVVWIITLVFGSFAAFGVIINLTMGLVVFIIILCYYAAVIGIRNNQSTAKYYLAAMGVQFLIVTLRILSTYHYIPISLSWKTLQWSTILEMLIFSFGLSKQVKQIEIDKQRINQELLVTKERLIHQLETINRLKDQVLSNVMESRLYPEFAKLFSIMKDIIYVQAIGSFSKVFFLDEGFKDEIEIEASLKDIERCFDETVFVRIHKTYLVKRVDNLTLQRRSSADYNLVSSQFTLPVGRKYLNHIKEIYQDTPR